MGVYGLAWTPAIVFEVTLTPGVQIWVQGPFGVKFKNLHFCHKTPQYGCLWTCLDPSYLFWGDLDPRAFWCQIQKSSLFSQNPTILVSVDSPGPQQPFLGWLGPQGSKFGSKDLLAPNLKFWTSITKLHKMGAYGIPWTLAVKIWHFRADFDLVGIRAFWQRINKLCFSHESKKYGCLWTPLNRSPVIWTSGTRLFWSFGSKIKNL